MLEQALKCGERSIKMRQVQRESPKRSISEPQGRAEKSPVENTEEPNYKSWSCWLYDQVSNVRSVHPRKKCFECYSCLLFLTFELLFSFISFWKYIIIHWFLGSSAFRYGGDLGLNSILTPRLDSVHMKRKWPPLGLVLDPDDPMGKGPKKSFEKQIAILSSYQGSRFDPVNQSTGAPNVNVWKISVRKAIWDLEFSEHFL